MLLFFLGFYEFNFAFDVCKDDEHGVIDFYFFLFFDEVVLIIDFGAVFAAKISESDTFGRCIQRGMLLRDWALFDD